MLWYNYSFAKIWLMIRIGFQASNVAHRSLVYLISVLGETFDNT